MPKDHNCPKCNKIILPEFNYKAGDKVYALNTTQKPMRDGRMDVQEKVSIVTVVGVDPTDKDCLEVKTANNRKQSWLRYSLVPADGPTQLDYRRIGRCQCESEQAS